MADNNEILELSQDDILGELRPEDIISEQSDPGKLEALARGAAQGATLGFADEITGGVKALGDIALTDNELSQLPELYKQYLAASRDAYKQAEEAHPVTSFVGNLAGGAAGAIGTGGLGLLGRGAVKAGAKLAAKEAIEEGAKAGLATGAVSGLGVSEADLTKGEVGDALGDVAMGGALGMGIGASIPAIVTGTKATANAFSDRLKKLLENSQTGKDITRSFKRGTEGVKMTGLEAEQRVTQKVVDDANWLTNLLERSKNKLAQQQGKAIDKAMEESGGELTVDFQKALQKGIDLLNDHPETFDEASRKRAEALLKKHLFEPTKETTSQISVTRNAKGKITKAVNKVTGEEIPLSELPETGFPRLGSEEGLPITASKTAKYSPKGKLKSVTETLKSSTTEELERGPVDPKQGLKIVQELQEKAFERPLPDSDVTNVLKTVAKESSDELKSKVPGLAPINQKLSPFIEATNWLGDPEVIRALGPDKTARDRTVKFVEELAKQMDTTGLKDQQVFFGILDKVNPKFSAIIKKRLTESSEDFQLVKRMQESSSIGGPVKQVLGSVRNLMVGGGNIAGRGINKAQKSAEQAVQYSKSLVNRNPDSLKMLANKIGQLQLPGEEHVKLAEILSQAAERDRLKRNALLFAIEQNPAYRQMINDVDQE